MSFYASSSAAIDKKEYDLKTFNSAALEHFDSSSSFKGSISTANILHMYAVSSLLNPVE